jgi:hypothetical protein
MQDISQLVRPRRRQCCPETPASQDLLKEYVKNSDDVGMRGGNPNEARPVETPYEVLMPSA